MFNIKFVLLFGQIPTNCYFYIRNDFVIESDLSKSYIKRKHNFSRFTVKLRALALKNVVSSSIARGEGTRAPYWFKEKKKNEGKIRRTSAVCWQ